MEMKPIIVCGEKLRYMACDDEEMVAKVGLPDKRNNRSFIKQCRNINSISLNDYRN